MRENKNRVGFKINELVYLPPALPLSEMDIMDILEKVPPNFLYLLRLQSLKQPEASLLPGSTEEIVQEELLKATESFVGQNYNESIRNEIYIRSEAVIARHFANAENVVTLVGYDVEEGDDEKIIEDRVLVRFRPRYVWE